MADWSNPKITSNYLIFVDEVKDRDFDAITLQKNALVNPPTGAIKLVRAPVKLQEWNGSAFVDLVLSVAGGGTGSSTPAGAGAALGLGTMSVQNANAVAISGGTITGVSLHGNIGLHSGTLSIYQSPGHAIVAYGPNTTAGYAGFFVGGTVAGSSYGLIVQAGFIKSDYSFQVRNQTSTLEGFRIRGDMVVLCPNYLVIPVGANRWAPV